MTDGGVPGGNMLHSPSARMAAARLATVHTLIIGVVIGLVAYKAGRLDQLTVIYLICLSIWSPIVSFLPWDRYSHNWIAKIYFLGAGSFVYFAFHLDNPYLLLGMFPELIVFADVYWYRRSALVFHEVLLLGTFTASALLIGGGEARAIVLIGLPLMAASALTIGWLSHTFIQSLLQRKRFQSTVTSLLEALHARDGYTGEHSKETLAMAMAVADQLELNDDQRKELADVALLHDIGKIGIPNSILQKAGPLDQDEWRIMRQHPVTGEEILRNVPGFETVAEAVRHEHERWDGGGYPDGLCAHAIPQASRIVLVCDAFHAMTSDRPYRSAMPESEARDELWRNSGTQFDPTVVAALDRAIECGALEQAITVGQPELGAVQTEYGLDADAPAAAAATINARFGADESGANAGIAVSLAKPEGDNTDLFDKPELIAKLQVCNGALIAVVMSAYLLVERSVDTVGAVFLAGVALGAAASFAMRRHRASRTWGVGSGFLLFAIIPLMALHYDEPSMLLFLLAPATTTSAFYWQSIPIRILQSVFVIGAFVFLPVILFGATAFAYAAVGARAFPGALLVTGYFTQRLLAMRFERQKFSATITSLLLALQARDGYTGEHSDETVRLAMRLAEEMKLSETMRMELKDVALLHDIGKIGVPDEVLNKPGKLNEEEWAIMRQHPAIGEQIVGRMPGFESVARAIRHEHERWDGGGYPDALAGEEIPLSSRIVLACDAYHAMTSDRPYRTSLGVAKARDELVRCAGTQFDPRVVGALLAILDDPHRAQLEAAAQLSEQLRIAV